MYLLDRPSRWIFLHRGRENNLKTVTGVREGKSEIRSSLRIGAQAQAWADSHGDRRLNPRKN